MNLFPKLLVDLSVVRSNLTRTLRKTQLISIDMCPHVKTIHDPMISDILKDEGIWKICVSNMDMLTHHVSAGWRHICLAIPFPHTSDQSGRPNQKIGVETAEWIQSWQSNVTHASNQFPNAFAQHQLPLK